MKETILDVFDIWLKSRLKNVHTCLPGTIEKYYGHTNQKAKVDIGVKVRTVKGTYLTIPPIDNVPVIFPSSGKFRLKYPLNKGDGCLILFSEEGIGSWLKGQAKVNSDSLAKFSLTDAICIPGLWSFPAVPSNTDGEIEIQDDGTIVLNGGTLGVARKNDGVDSDSSTDASYWAWLSGLMAVFQAWIPVPGDGGTALKTALTAYLLANPTPTALASKITGASDKVKAG